MFSFQLLATLDFSFCYLPNFRAKFLQESSQQNCHIFGESEFCVSTSSKFMTGFQKASPILKLRKCGKIDLHQCWVPEDVSRCG